MSLDHRKNRPHRSGDDGQQAKSKVAENMIIDMALAGDEQAFERLFNRYRKNILATCLDYCDGDTAKAMDLCQETFISAFFALDQLRDKSRFAKWLYEIAKHKCISYTRKQHTLDRVMKDYEVVKQAIIDNEQPWSDNEIELVEEMIKKISKPDFRRTITLYYIEGKKSKEIAKIQGISQSLVTTRLNRFRTRIHKRITQEIIKRRASQL